MKPVLPAVITGTMLLLLHPCASQAQPLWVPYPGNPVFAGNVSEPAVVFDSARQTYMMWFVQVGGGIWEASSTNGLTWAPAESIAVQQGQAGTYDHIIYTVEVVRFGNGYFMYYTASSTGDTVTIELATSTDGVHWQKHPGSPALTPGPAGTWEFPRVLGPKITVVNDTLYMIYGGYLFVNQKLGLATSTDGITWVKNPGNPVLQPGGPTSPDAGYVGAAGLAYSNGTFYLIYRATDASGADSYSLAMSSDAAHWQKYAGNPVYPAHRTGWDSFGIGGGSLLWANGGFRFWYCGTSGFTSWSIGLASLSLAVTASPATLDFGWVAVGTVDTLSVTIGNVSMTDTLRVTSIASTNPVFRTSLASVRIPPGADTSLQVTYAPNAAVADTGSITLLSDAPGVHLLRISVSGHGSVVREKPVISGLALVPGSSDQIRMRWIRSSHDTTGDPDQVVQYSIWRQVPGTPATQPTSGRLPGSTLVDPLWDYIQSVPAVGFEEYSTVVAAAVNSGATETVNIFMVAAHTKNLHVFMSDPDTTVVQGSHITAIDGPAGPPGPHEFALQQNYPNPFNPSTTIRYALAQNSHVTLSVFNTLGQIVSTPVDAEEQAGDYEVRFDGSNLASGVYFYRLSAGSFVRTKRLLLVR
jgi:predicted GH43/DUF377 family glycosyl hydrolase